MFVGTQQENILRETPAEKTGISITSITTDLLTKVKLRVPIEGANFQFDCTRSLPDSKNVVRLRLRLLDFPHASPILSVWVD
jgi:hypothetical protein